MHQPPEAQAVHTRTRSRSPHAESCGEQRRCTETSATLAGMAHSITIALRASQCWSLHRAHSHCRRRGRGIRAQQLAPICGRESRVSRAHDQVRNATTLRCLLMRRGFPRRLFDSVEPRSVPVVERRPHLSAAQRLGARPHPAPFQVRRRHEFDFPSSRLQTRLLMIVWSPCFLASGYPQVFVCSLSLSLPDSFHDVFFCWSILVHELAV